MTPGTYILRKGISSVLDLKDGAALLGFGAGAKSIYFCDNNAGSDGNEGSSWERSFKTLAYALSVSHADIASGAQGWAARNVIFIKGDSFVESLTKLAQKTDIIGVGSCDHLPSARVVGNHAIGTTSYMGCRFINVQFQAPAAGGDIFTIPTQQSGISFINCTFDANSTVAAGGAIIATTSEMLTVQGCTFRGAWADAVIEIAGTENNALLIADNIIQGGQQGIDVKSTVTTSIRSGYILRNVINSVTECINEASGKIYVHDNLCVTAAAKGTAGAGGIVAGAYMMLNNRLSASDVANALVPAAGSL